MCKQENITHISPNDKHVNRPSLMKKSIICIIALQFCLVVMTYNAFGQDKPEAIDYLELSAGMTAISGEAAPLFLWINQNGRIPVDNSTQYLRLRAGKKPDYLEDSDWFYGIDLTGRTGDDDHVMITDCFAGISSEYFSLSVGKKTEFFGLADSLLTIGPEVYSRNAPTIPKVALSTNGYVELTGKIAVNAYLAHGWLGDERYIKNAFLHQKHLFIRYGDTYPNKGFNVFGGLHHLAVWGGTNRVTGEKNPSGLDDFFRVFTGMSGDEQGNVEEQENSLGNHLGSIEFALQLKGINQDWLFYAQTMFEDGSGLVFVVPGDYLLGASFINKRKQSIVQRINVEYLETRYTGYSPHEPGHPDYGLDDYFNNYMYLSGWTYNGYGIGHPFIPFIPGTDYTYTALNRARGMNVSTALHFSKLINPVVRCAYIENYGSFNQPLENPVHVVAADLTNVSVLPDNWLITQQLSWDSENDFGAGLVVRKKIF